MRDAVLVLEADRSSIRFAVFRRCAAGAVTGDLRGGLTHLHGHARFRVHDAAGRRLADIDCADETAPGHAIAIEFLFNWLALHAPDLAVRAIGHRFADDGGRFAGPVRVDAAVLADLDAGAAVDPGGCARLSLAQLLDRRAPRLPQIACFDSTFHAAMPPLARAFDALTRPPPRVAYPHGLAYEDLLARLSELDARAAGGRIVAVHLHAAVALCAMAGGRVVAATPDFRRRMRLGDAARRAGGPVAPAPGDLLRYRVAREIGSLVAALGGLDAVAFAVGGDARGARLRDEVLRDMAWLAVERDPAEGRGPRLSRPESPVAAYLVPVDPARSVARRAFEIAAS